MIQLHYWPTPNVDLAPYAEVRRWHEAIGTRPAVQRAHAVGDRFRWISRPPGE